MSRRVRLRARPHPRIVRAVRRVPTPPPAPAAGFEPDTVSALAQPLDRSHIRSRDNGRSKVDYIEGWRSVRRANDLFGFEGWDRVTDVALLYCELEVDAPEGQKPRWIACYQAKVRIIVRAGGREIIRDGCGLGDGLDPRRHKALELALKEAETDATKRALTTFGNQFGLALYDKERADVGRNLDVDPFLRRAIPVTPSDAKAYETAFRARIGETDSAEERTALYAATITHRSEARRLMERSAQSDAMVSDD